MARLGRVHARAIQRLLRGGASFDLVVEDQLGDERHVKRAPMANGPRALRTESAQRQSLNL